MAPVRSLRSFGNPKPIPVIHAIPPAFAPAFKIELVNNTDTYDISDLIESGNIKNGVTDNIGNFYFKIVDPSRNLSDAISNFDNVNVYLDYGANATTLRFKGVIERNPREDIYFKIYGRSIAMIVMGKNIIYAGVNKKRSEVLTEVLNANFPEVDTSGIEEDTTLVNVNYSEISFQDIMEEICGKHHDFYIDANLKAYYFEKGSKINSTEAVAAGANHISTDFYGADSDETISRVRVYGKKEGDITFFSTSDSNTEHTNGIVKERKINDTSLITSNQTTERANFEYTAGLSIPSVGSVTSLLLPTLAPGEKLFMGVPLDKIDPDYYVINSFVHKFPILQTELIIQQKGLNMNNVIKSSARNIFGVSEQENPNDMDFSQVITFDTDSGIHSNTVINEGFLKVLIGQNSGSWTSDLIELDEDVTKIEFKFTGDYLVQQYGATTSYIWFSLDGGTTWRVYTSDTVEVPTGRDLKIRIDLNADNAQVKAVAVLYKFN